LTECRLGSHRRHERFFPAPDPRWRPTRARWFAADPIDCRGGICRLVARRFDRALLESQQHAAADAAAGSHGLAAANRQRFADRIAEQVCEPKAVDQSDDVAERESKHIAEADDFTEVNDVAEANNLTEADEIAACD
jgi:hypothetical protein